MPVTFENTEEKDGLTFKLYRGEGMALAAFDLAKGTVDEQFVGFTVQYRPPGASDYFTLTNRLAFHYDGQNKGKQRFPTTRAPLQKFRWTHVPPAVEAGTYRYRLTDRRCRASSGRSQ